jgi:excisionase family DNA binding protein
MAQSREPADDRYLGVGELARYSGLSQHTVRKHFTDARRPLKHYRIGGRILVKKSEFDQWMEEAAVAGGGSQQAPRRQIARDVDAEAAEAIKAIREGKQ